MKSGYNKLVNGFKIDFEHLNRMQKRVMAKESWLTEKEFLKESLKEQFSYYRWLCQQCGELADLI